jgi:hypothetical protein
MVRVVAERKLLPNALTAGKHGRWVGGNGSVLLTGGGRVKRRSWRSNPLITVRVKKTHPPRTLQLQLGACTLTSVTVNVTGKHGQ